MTANGKLLTWGAYSNGALGLGDPLKLKPGIPGAYSNGRELTAARSGGRPRVNPVGAEIPTEVRFDHGSKKQRERFCFATTAAGWHTGALVIDLQVRLILSSTLTCRPGYPKTTVNIGAMFRRTMVRQKRRRKTCRAQTRMIVLLRGRGGRPHLLCPYPVYCEGVILDLAAQVVLPMV